MIPSQRMLLLCLLLHVFVYSLSGCATYGMGAREAISHMRQGDFAASETALKEHIKPTGNDRLLYHMELGVIKHLQGQYKESNQLLEKAERIAENLETTYLTDSLVVMMSNPRQGPYGGLDFEKVFINYYKAINYFSLASQAATQTERFNALDGARIEARRLTMRLNELNDRKGTYSAVLNEEQSLFEDLLGVFKLLHGNLLDLDRLQYRDDAMSHYLTGISYEMNDEYDNARISYRKAAESYELGFAKQYRLGSKITEQAWLDVIRMMRSAGGYEQQWKKLAKQKLTSRSRSTLAQWNQKGVAQLIVLEHKGLIPERKEMNLNLSVNPRLKTLEVQPYIIGNDKHQLAWFYLLYADKGLADIMTDFLDYSSEGWFYGINFTHRIPLGPLWYQAERIGLTDVIGDFMRITVPYYEAPKKQEPTTLKVAGKDYSMIKASCPAQIAIQEQMVNSGKDIQRALARASLKALAAVKIGDAAKGVKQLESLGGLISAVGQIAAQLTEAAETRNWLTLPAEIRIRRIPLPAGEHEAYLDSLFNKGQHKRLKKIMTLKAGDIHLWQVRTLAPEMAEPPPETILDDHDALNPDTHP